MGQVAASGLRLSREQRRETYAGAVSFLLHGLQCIVPFLKWSDCSIKLKFSNTVNVFRHAKAEQPRETYAGAVSGLLHL